MITTNTMQSENKSYQAMYTRRQLDLVWTTTPIQPLQQTWTTSQMLQIILQRSRHMIPIGQIQISFRPVVQYSSGVGTFNSLAQKMMTCVTLVNPADVLCFQSATVEGNQLCSMTNFSLTRSRNLVQNYINQLENIKDRMKMRPDDYSSGVIYPSGQGSRNTGFEENSVTHPYSISGTQPAYGSRFEADPYPRAIIERNYAYNADFCAGVAGNLTYPQSEYFSSQVTVNADGLLSTAAVVGQYPLLPLSITPSINIYKRQQSRFAAFRQRFITAMVTSYYLPTLTAAQNGITNIVSNATVTGGAATTLAGQQKVIYGQPINGVYGAGQGGVGPVNGLTYGGSSVIGSGVARTSGQQFTATSTAAAYAPGEQYTNCQISIAETAVEFNESMGGIGMMCMDSTQLVIQYNINRPECCLSAYLQPSYFASQSATASTVGATPANNQIFLNCCLLGDTTIQLTDVCLRVPYYSYNDEEAYSIVRELTYQPKSYYSLRQQIDPILGSGQQFSRLSIGGSSLIAGVWIFIVPQAAVVPALTATSPSAGDCMVNYFGVNPPGVADLRNNQPWDSYYVTMQDIYVQVNNKRYTVNAIPIQNPELSTYLVTQSGVESAFGKFLNIPYSDFLANRFAAFIPVNPYSDRSQIITDNQLIVSLSLDFSSRIASSQMYGETNLSPANKFALVTVAMTMQSMVDCSYVKIA